MKLSKQVVMISLDKIILDDEANPRCGVVERLVEKYLERFVQGDEFPPLDTFIDGVDYRSAETGVMLSDGIQRKEMYRRAGVKECACFVHSGSKLEAMLYGARQNEKHGATLSVEDVAHTLRALLKYPKYKTLSIKKLSKEIGCSWSTAAKAYASIGTRPRQRVEDSRGASRPATNEKHPRKVAQKEVLADFTSLAGRIKEISEAPKLTQELRRELAMNAGRMAGALPAPAGDAQTPTQYRDRLVYSLHTMGCSSAFLAEVFNLSEPTINKIIQRGRGEVA